MNAMQSKADLAHQNNPNANLSRRNFLDLAGKTFLAASSLLGLDYLTRFLNFQTEPPPETRFDLGPSSQYPFESRTVISEASAILYHTQTGFFALSLICPHLGCTLEAKPDRFTCPCHGSKFTPTGGLLNGPANKPMRILRVETAVDGNLILYTGD
jgi:cytochrome b6-f complex iron-sulfur subunit